MTEVCEKYCPYKINTRKILYVLLENLKSLPNILEIDAKKIFINMPSNFNINHEILKRFTCEKRINPQNYPRYHEYSINSIENTQDEQK